MDPDQLDGGATLLEERRRVLQLVERARQRSRERSSRSASSSRSRTPSPILGRPFSIGAPNSRNGAGPFLGEEADGGEPLEMGEVDPLSRLSMPMLGLGLGPSKEEVELLVYGSSHDKHDPASKPSSDGDGASREIEQVLSSLASMGLDEASKDSNATEREKELAGMVKQLAQTCNDLSRSRDRATTELHSNRVTALSVISSMKTAHAHALATERSVHDRLDAELEGWKAQAKMLGVLLSRAGARSYVDRRIPEAAEFSGPASSAWASSSRLPASRSDDSIGGSGMARTSSETSNAAVPPLGSHPLSAQRAHASFEPGSPSKVIVSAGLTEPSSPAGEEGRGRNRSKESLAFAAQVEARSEAITGLGISNASVVEVDMDPSPMSVLVRERNKLSTDKRYLKARLRDTEAQVHRLESELKSLRPFLVAGGIKITESARTAGNGAGEAGATPTTASNSAAAGGATTAPATPNRSGGRKDKSRKKRTVTMGDAETEHLMLAARRLRELRMEQAAASLANGGEERSARSDASSAHLNGASVSVLASTAEVPSSGAHASPIKRQASEGLDHDRIKAGSQRMSFSKTGERPPKTSKSNNDALTTPRPNQAASHGDRTEIAGNTADLRAPAHGSQHKRFESSTSASSFTGIDELLQAAETLNPGAATSSPPMRTLPEHQTAVYSGSDARSRYLQEALPVPTNPAHAYYPSQDRGVEYDHYGYPQHHVVSSPIRLPHESPKRRRVSSAAIDVGPFGSPFISGRQPRGRTSTEGAYPYGRAPAHLFSDYPHDGHSVVGSGHALSALDLLADQAAASQNPSLGSDRSGGYDGVSPLGSLSSDDDVVTLNDGTPSRAKRSKGGEVSKAPPQRSVKSPARGKAKGASGASANDASQSSSKSNGETRSFGGNQNPEKRLPYVRWTNEEDTKLRAAIKEHGQRWELISRAVGTRSYHQCRQRYLLMRRKEAAAKAQAEADEAANTASASASDQQSQEEGDRSRGPPASASVSRKSGGMPGRHGRGGGGGGRSTNDERYDDNDGGLSDDGSEAANTTATPLHKLSIGAPPAGNSGHSHAYGPYSPAPRQGPLGPISQASTHSLSLSHPHGPSTILPPGQQAPPLSPYSSHHSTTPTARRTYYPSSSPLIAGSRQLPPLSHAVGGAAVNNYASSPTRHAHVPSSPLHNHRQFMDGPLGGRGAMPHAATAMAGGEPSQTTPTNDATRRMGQALYS
ncbi:hypothetical protein ACQY0O_006628 [Thecaphora frezii]